jgi:DNA-directed RNA polymerase specialized sigma24 family protein
MSMGISKHEIYVKALLEGYEELQEKKYSGKWHLADEMRDLDKAIELADLTDKQAYSISLYYLEHLEQSDIALVLEVSQQMVAKHLSAAVKKIARIYEQWEALEYAE